MFGNFGNMNPNYNPNNPYQSRLNSMTGTPSQPMDIITVNGENGARALNMPPNSRVLLLDENNPIVWFAQTDGAGYKTVTAYNITPMQAEKPIDAKTLEQRISRLEEIINGKSNNVGNEKNATDTATAE